MNVNDFINPSKKKPWLRRVVSDSASGSSFTYKVMTQDDFLNEVCEAAHPINSAAMSRRPIIGPTGKKDAKGKDEWGIVGYDPVETVPVGIQEAIIGKKVSHFAADGFWTASETEDEESFSTLMSWADSVGLKTAFIAAIKAAFRTGDSAVYLYQTDDIENPIDYEVYDYEHGSTLFPKTDINGKQSIARKYKWEKHDAVDIFTTEKIETWMMLDDNGDEDILPLENRIKSDDGYTLIRSKAAQAGSNLCQCIYFRVDDIPTGPAQDAIEKLEQGKTYVGEHLKGSTMPILFVKAEKTTSLPPTNYANKIVGVKGSSDSLAHADMKFVTPGDASNIATLHLDGLTQDILDTCMSVFVRPDIVKQGSDSSSTMKILYNPEVQWCQVIWPQIFKSAKQMMLVFKSLVGKVEGEPAKYSKMRISVGQNIYIPMNSAEALKMELDSVYGRIKSRKAAIQDSGNSHRGDYKQIQDEWVDELTWKAEIPAKAKAKYGTEAGEDLDGDKNPANVDNNASGKSIQV